MAGKRYFNYHLGGVAACLTTLFCASPCGAAESAVPPLQTTSTPPASAATPASPATQPTALIATASQQPPAKNNSSTRARKNQMINPNLPEIKEAQLGNFAQAAVLSVFTYDYNDANVRLQDALKKYFSEKGQRDFTAALSQSNNLAAVNQYKLKVSARIFGTPQIVNHLQQDNIELWLVTVPVVVTYTDPDNKALTQNLIAKLAIVRQANNNNPIAIEEFIAVPNSPNAVTTAPAQNTPANTA